MAIRAELDDLDVAPEEPYFADLGFTFDTAFLKKRRVLLTGQAKKLTANLSTVKDHFIYEFVSDQETFSKTIKASASGNASFGLAKASASGSYRKFFSSNSYSCYLFGFFRIIRPTYGFDITKCDIEENLLEFIKANYEANPDLIEKELGDEVITRVTLASEILVKLEIQTNSESQKEKIKASASASGKFGGLTAGGTASFSSLVKQITDYKKLIIDVYGDIPNQFMSDVTVAEVDKLLLEYPARSQSFYSILHFESMLTKEVPKLIKYYTIFEKKDLRQRKEFCAAIDKSFQDLSDWESDIDYVLSPANANEFSEVTKSQAKKDKTECLRLQETLMDLYNGAEDYWDTFGRNDEKFDENLITGMPVEYPIYPRLEPVVAPVVVKKKKPRKKKESSRYNGNSADRGIH